MCELSQLERRRREETMAYGMISAPSIPARHEVGVRMVSSRVDRARLYKL